MKRFATSLALILTIATLGACRKEQPAEVRYGVILSQSGAAAPYGQDNLRGLQLAQEVLNEKGGVLGRRVNAVVNDDAGDPAQAVALARKYSGEADTLAIIGPTRTGCTVAVAKLLPTLQIPMMSVGSTGDWKSAAGDFNPWTFRSTRVDTFLVPPLLQYLRDKRAVKRVAILSTTDDDWSRSVLKVYEQAAQDLSLTIVANERQMTADTDRSPQLTKIMAAKPDVFVINTLSTDAPTIATQARRLGITTLLASTAGFTNKTTWKLADPGVLDGAIVADNFYSDDPRPAVREFVRRYTAKFKTEPPSYAAYAYDGLMIVADATRRAGEHPTRTAVRDAIGTTSNFDGLLGTLTYNGPGDAKKQPFILEIRNGAYHRLE